MFVFNDSSHFPLNGRVCSTLVFEFKKFKRKLIVAFRKSATILFT